MRLIDANDVKKRGDCYLPDIRKTIANILSHTKTVKDAVVVVRCKDCKHYNAGFECLIEGYGIERDKDWYCADSERRNDE